MKKAILLITFKLAPNKSIEEFFEASKKFNDIFISKQKGYISWKQFVDGDEIADIVEWERADDARVVLDKTNLTPEKIEFFSYVDYESCKVNIFTQERSYM